MNQTNSEDRILMLYSLFVNQNPSFRNYVITVGFRMGHRSREHLSEFCERITCNRSDFGLYQRALISFHNNSWICN